jgi:hypothetical protein
MDQSAVSLRRAALSRRFILVIASLLLSTLAPSTDRKLYVNYGKGSNGKSLFSNMLEV